jgi:PAS domain S-box-containing protein
LPQALRQSRIIGKAVAVRLRHIAPVALVLALTVAGFLVARLVAERDAQRDAEHRAEVAAAQIRDRVAQGASLTESLRRFMLDTTGTGVTSDQFARNASRWLSPGGFAAAAWAERVPDSRRAAYERRVGQPIVSPDERRRVVPVGSRSSYLPATLVSGFDPMAVPGTDLSGEPGMAAVLTRATRLDGVAATPVEPRRTGTSGLFLVAPAPNLIGEVLRFGYVVVFVSDQTLRAAASDVPTVQITSAGTSTEARERTNTASRSFTEAEQRFDVLVPQEAVVGAAAVVPWIILAAGLVLAALAAALGVSSVRRARAQDELDRIFTLSSDLIVVADFDGHFTRVNPAAERILGYTEEELLSRPYLDLVHPDDREKTASEAAAIGHGKTTVSFENRYVRNDGSYRVLEWTSTPIVEDGLMYGMARDVTERRRTEAEANRLADEQAALRRVATLVAREASQAEVFAAIAEEIGQLLGTEEVRMLRYEDDRSAVVVASRGDKDILPIGFRLGLEDDSTTSRVFRTGRAARIDDYARVSGPIADQAPAAIRCVVATPVVVEDRLWGAIAAGTSRAEPLPPDTESRMGQFTELMATAIANTESHAKAERLGDEQAALRRVATLVAEGAPPTAVLDAVAGEMEALLDADQVALNRFEPGDEILVLAHRGLDVARTPVGSRLSTQGESVTATVRRTGRPARMENYEEADGALAELARTTGLRSSVSAPIVVEGRLWGLVTASWKSEESPPPDTEERMSEFAQLLDTAIANADSRDQLTASRARLLSAADEARRRVVRDLHDGAQQRMVHTIVMLKLAQRALQQKDGEAESLVGDALEQAEKGNAELRELAHGILPAALARGGLRAGLDAVVARLDLPVPVDVPAERFPAEIEASAYFIVAEALTNVVKHSHAGRAEVSASVQNGTLSVEVRDDGIGGADPNGHGLVGMADRVAALGGRLEIESPAGGGTLVAATLPLTAG